MGFRLTREQQAAVTNRGGSLLVSAAAGSGKTRVLVERLLCRMEEEHTDIDRFLVITYTRAAAAELRSRIAAELSDRLALHPEDAFLRRQATRVYQAQISTVDAFCAQFLREEGHRLELDHDARLCEENEANILLEDVLSRVLEERYEQLEPGGDFACLVDTMADGRSDSRLVQILLDVRGKIQSHPNPERWLEEQGEVFALEGVTDAGETPWGKVLLEDARRQADYWAGRMQEALELCQGDDKLMKGYAPSLQGAMHSLLALSQAARIGWNETREKLGQAVFLRFGGVRNCEDPAAQERIKFLWKQCKDRVERLKKNFLDDSQEILEDMRGVYPAIRGLFALIRDLERAFSEEKRRRGVLDFSDLEHLAARLLVGENGEPTELAHRWSERFEEVMVDEYQDANAIQDALFQALSGGGKKLFMVGDVKQSIYRFRLADPTIFLKKYASFPLWENAEEGKERKILLSRNFRSRPQVLEGCNSLFRAIMSPVFGEMDYTDAEALYPKETPFPGEEKSYAVELDLLDCSQAEEDGEEGAKPRRSELEARFVARRIHALLREGFPISDGEGGLRPVTPGDVVVLIRSPGPVLQDYAAALGELDIPWEAEGAGNFFEATEIQVALSLLKIIDNPRQDVSLIAVLRSAAFGFSADRLAQVRANSPQEDFYTALTLDDGEDVRDFLIQLKELRRRAGDESCDRLLWRLYDRTNLLGIYGAMDEGETRASNLLTLARLAGEFEGGEHRGLYGFLTYLRRLEEQGRSPNLPKVSVGGGGVKIMSIHRSKGLEFPVVILAGLSRKRNASDMKAPMLFHPELGVGPWRLDLERMLEYPTLARLAVAQKMDREQAAEELRLLYVAMTRAQDKLILSCALTRGRNEVDKLLASAGAPVEPQALLERETPAQWILLHALARPEAAALRGDALPPPVRPDFPFGPAWDIHWEEPLEEKRLRHTGKSPEEREYCQESPEALLESFRWAYPYQSLAELPSKLTATQLKGRDLDTEASEEAGSVVPGGTVSDGEELQQTKSGKVEMARSHFNRPRFAAEQLGLTPAQKGIALHLVMQYIDFTRCDSAEHIEAEISRLVEEAFLTAQQGEAVEPERILAFFTSPLGRELMRASALRREFKFSLLVPAGRYYPEVGAGEQVLLQGVVDCYFESDEGITVVDFKTDQVHGERLEERAREYAPQLNAYGEALEEITGKPVVRKVLWFFSEGRGAEV